MLSSNFSRLIIAHYFKYNNIFEKKGEVVWTHGPIHDAFGFCFCFLPARKSKEVAFESEYAISSINQFISLLRWLNNFIFTSQHFILQKILTIPFPIWYI